MLLQLEYETHMAHIANGLGKRERDPSDRSKTSATCVCVRVTIIERVLVCVFWTHAQETVRD